MSDLRYTQQHEWLAIDGDVSDGDSDGRSDGRIVTMGITEHAQEQLGDIVFVELPNVGQEVSRGEEVIVIESVKAAGEIHAPLSGVITEINEHLVESPETVNEDPTGAGWFFKLRIDNALGD